MSEEKTIDVKVTTPSRITESDLILLQRIPTKVPAIPSVNRPEDVAICIERIKQIVETREGNRGSFIEKNVTWRDLIGSGLAKISVDGITYNPGGGGGGGVQPPTNPGDTPILTQPPAPTGLTAIGAMTTIFVEWNNPGYSYHGYTEVWRADSNVLGNAVLLGTSLGTIYIDEPGATASKYYWVRFVSKWNIIGPYNDTDGTLATTGADINYLLEVLEGQITQTQLDASLSAEIDQIDTLALEVATLSAGVAGAFDPFKTYYFDASAEGWIADTAATVSQSNGHLVVDSTGTTPSIKLTADMSPALAGANYPVVKARVKRVSGSTWSGKLQWKTAGHGFSGSNELILSDPTIAIGDYAVIEWDLSANTDYTSSAILNLRIEIGAASDDDFDVDWIATGRNAPGASVAMVGEETTARVAADAAEVTQRQLLSAKVFGVNDPSSIDELSDITSGMLYEEMSVRASEDGAIADSVTTLSTTVGQNTTAIQTHTTSINGLSAQYTVKIDSNGYVSGFGLASENPTGVPGGQISTFGIRADTFYIANPTGPGVPPSLPFIVKTTSWVSPGGITNPPGVYMRSAYIADGEIINAKIGSLAVDDAKIASLSAAKITSGLIAADRLDANVITSKVLAVDVAKLTTGIIGGNIFSQSYSPNSSGWVIQQNGFAQFNNVEVRGGVYASYGVFSGSLNAATGTFAGSLSGAIGTFGGVVTGSLSAATGTFSGVLTAQAINAVNTINIADNAVIIPATAEYIGNWIYGAGVWVNVLGATITLPEFTKLFITVSLVMTHQNFTDPPSTWGFRLLRHDGTPIQFVGPVFYGGAQKPMPVVTFARQWAEPAGTWNFGVQFFGDANADAACNYAFISIIGARKS